MEGAARFLIVDDHPIFRHGLIALLERDPRYRVIAEAGTIDEALAALRTEVPDMILLDISLGRQSGLDLLKALRADYPETKTLVISIHDEAVYAERALRAHARGYIIKQEASSVLGEAVASILSGRIFVSAAIETQLLEQSFKPRPESLRTETTLLSDREREVLKAMGQGFGAREIASLMDIAVKTVNVYQDHIKKKLSLESISELRKYAIRWVQTQ